MEIKRGGSYENFNQRSGRSGDRYSCRLFRKGHQVVMTEIACPLTVRRQVAFSRTVYEKRAVVEEMEAVLVKDASQMQQAVSSGKVAVIVDPEARFGKYISRMC